MSTIATTKPGVSVQHIGQRGIDIAGLRELETLAKATNYYRWIYDIARPYIGERVLEVGGGIGEFSQFLLDRQRLVTLDYDPACSARLGHRFEAHNNIRVLCADIMDASLAESLQGERLDTAVCINVLEHIDDDRSALASMYRALQPGGHLIVLVPAHPQLYGTLDALVGHFRRYKRSELVDKMSDAGFNVRRSTYFNSAGAAGRFFIGRVRRQQAVGAGQIRFYDRCVVPVLARVERIVPPPFGQSVVVIGRK